MTAFFNRHESDPIDKLREAIEAMEREALKPIPIAPLPMDPEVEKRIWTWYVSFLP